MINLYVRYGISFMNTDRYRIVRRFLDHYTRRGPPIRSGVVYERFVEFCESNNIEPMSIQMFSVAVVHLFGVERLRSGGKSYMALALSDRYIHTEDRLPDQSPGSRADIARQSYREPKISELKRRSKERLRAKRRSER